MSVFQVKLNQGNQGTLDINPATGVEFSTSVQRTMYVAGPNGKIREVVDGTTFTDCNYWKRFAVPAVSANDAFIVVLSDDGSVYSDIATENTYPVVDSLTVSSGEDYTDNVIDIAGDTGNFAAFVQMTNTGTDGSGDVLVKLNGSSGAVFTLTGGTTQVFNAGDISVTQIAMQPVSSGFTGPSVVEVIYSVTSVCTS
jgi:hypothetical protein